MDEEHPFRVVDALDEVAQETGRTIPQIAIAWLLARPTVVNVIIGARNDEQLRANLVAADLQLSAAQIAKLSAASATTPPYPTWHQMQVKSRNPRPV